MKLLVVNPNITDEMTETMRLGAQKAAAPGTEVVASRVAWGSPSIESAYEGYISAAGVLDRLHRVDADVDAVILAGFGEPGHDAAQELLDIPVFDITECAAHMACLLGRRFSVVTTVHRAVAQVEDRLLLAGLKSRCASVRATGMNVLELEENRSGATDSILAQATAARDVDGAEAIILGCGGMAGLDKIISDHTGLPVIDGIAAAVGFAEAVVRFGLMPSKTGSFAPPPKKQFYGWPITAAPPAHNEAAPVGSSPCP